MAKAATVYDVAERAGVSIATVSMTFRRPHKVREETRRIVEVAAEELNYVPSASARGLAHGHTGALGLYSYNVFLPEPEQELAWEPADRTRSRLNVEVIRDEADEDYRRFPLYVHEVQRGFEVACWQRGYALLLGADTQPASVAQMTDIVGRVDGLAVFPHSSIPDVLERLSRRIPVVALSQGPGHQGISTVSVDNRGGMRALIEHLISEHRLRDLLFVGYTNTYDSRERFAGFRSAMRAAGLAAPTKLPAHLDVDRTPHAEIVSILQASDSVPEAFVCVTDEVALDLIKALTAAGVRVPERVAVTGFDGLVAGRIASPALTTVRQPLEAIGRTATDILVEQIGNPSGTPVDKRLPVELVLRRSCGCPSA